MVQLAIGVGHAMEEYWGSDVQEIDLERFVRKESLGKSGDVDGPGSARMMRAAFQPFGGGIHHCPGRRLAFVEMMAFMATMVLGYEVQPLEGNKGRVPGFGPLSMVDAVAKPAHEGEGFGVRVRKRKGWESVRWRYEV